MRQKFLIFTALIFLVLLLIGLNAASYVQKEKTPDSETNPNRSTYNAGATGTRAFYDLLAETGRRVTRWQEPPAALSASGKNKPQTFVVIGTTKREFTERETVELLQWVSDGGRLVIIAREPPTELIKTTANWSVSAVTAKAPTFFDVDPSDQAQMTEKTIAAKPLQPTVLTNRVNAVQPSRFASSVSFSRFSDAPVTTKTISPPPGGIGVKKANVNYYVQSKPPPVAPPTAAPSRNGTGSGTIRTAPTSAETEEQEAETEEQEDEEYESPALAAPVAHLGNDDKILLADFPFGSGQIVFLTDPYIVSNGGINLVDNAQLAINLVAADTGLIAFDEFHQGYGAGDNRLLGYFAGTPLTAIILQFAWLAGLILFSQSRRFARPLPEDEPNRLSKLEYVAAMAELQRRTRAYDLAIENIYTDFRRRAARLVGADNFTVSLRELAQLIAERAGLNAAELERLMFKCEEIVRGEPTGRREVLDLTSRLRAVEKKLGLKRGKTARR